jgi:hypothetical protein
LIVLIQEIRAGRAEGDCADWKRAFWDFGVEKSSHEFLKDIAAMANSLGAEPVRRLIIGVAQDGSLLDARLPVDESELQRRLAAITPVPTLKAEQHTLEGKTVTVLEVHPPFDRPYVTKINSDHFVWIRQGSATVTASRYHLDAFYRARERAPLISVQWRGDIVPTLGRARSVDQLKAEAIGRLEEGRLRAALARDAAAAKARLERFEASCRSYLDILDKPSEIWRIYHDAFTSTQGKQYRAGQEVRIEVTNNGSSPASNIRAELRFPNWIHVCDGAPFPKRLQFLPDLKWLDPPPHPEPEKVYEYAGIPGLIPPGRLSGFDLDSINRASEALSLLRPPPPPALRIDHAGQVVSASIERLSPKATTGAGLRFHLYPLGNAPSDAVDFEIRIRVICDETGIWSDSVLRGIIGGGAVTEAEPP